MAILKKSSAITLSAAVATLLAMSGCGSSSSGGGNTSSSSSVSSVSSSSSSSVSSSSSSSISSVSSSSSSSISSVSSSSSSSVSSSSSSSAGTVEVLSGTITGDMTLDATKVYEISGKVDFTGGTLTIPAGTVLYGQTPASYLAINRGAKIDAVGTLAKPIVFTSKLDYEGKSHDNAQGEWGGLILLGNAWTNLGEQTYEAGDEKYGSDTHANDGESSGHLEYVVVKHTGFEVETDKELNGLSLGGVGSGTIVKNVAIIGGADDGIEIWGGTVNLEGVYIYNASDDSFDTDLGYSGTVKNVVAQQVIVDKDTYDSSTLETGNDKDLINNDVNITKTHVVNGTFYAVGGGIYMKNDAGMTLDNVQVVESNEVNGSMTVVKNRTEDVYTTNQMYAINTGVCLKNTKDATALYATANSKDAGESAYNMWKVDTMIKNAAGTAGNLNVHEDDLSACTGADVPSVWKGKAGSNDPIESPIESTEVLSGTISSDKTLSPRVAYEIDGKVDFTGGTLTIPEGTILFGKTPASYLAINRGSKIHAVGLKNKPIVFTSALDYNGQSHDNAQGEWGGLIILGNAWTNLGEQTYEAGDEKYGSDTHANDGESSGHLEYVVVKHSGFEVETDKELNGLSLGGVGSGTIVKNVAIIGGADDGIEIWGGTVDLEGVYVYNASDDSFDTDLGYSGTVTNIMAQQNIVDKDTYDSSTLETGNDKDLINNDVNITKTHVVNGTFYAVGGGIYMKNDAGMTLDNVKVIESNEVNGSMTVVKNRTEDVYTTDKMYAINTGVCLKNTKDATALYATANSKDAGKSAYDMWAVDTMIKDASDNTGNINVHEDDDTSCAGATEASIWKGMAASNDPLETK